MPGALERDTRRMCYVPGTLEADSTLRAWYFTDWQHSFRCYVAGALQGDSMLRGWCSRSWQQSIRWYLLRHPASSLLQNRRVFLIVVVLSDRDAAGRLLHQSGKKCIRVLKVTVFLWEEMCTCTCSYRLCFYIAKCKNYCALFVYSGWNWCLIVDWCTSVCPHF